MKKFLHFMIIFLIPLLAFCQDAQSLFNKANVLYQKKDYKKSLELFDSIEKLGYRSADLYFNLGNVYYKLEKFPEAILNYERARRIAGNKDDIVFNIALTNLNIPDKIDPIDQIWIFDFWDSLVNSRDSESWAIIMIIILWLSLIFITIFNFFSSVLIRRISSILFLIGFLSFIFTGIITYKRYKTETNSNYAIVFSPNVYVKSAPDAQSTDIFLVHAGVKAEIVEKVGEWYQIRLAAGKKGWLVYTNLEII